MVTFLPLIKRVYPRILTQVCRDPGSPAYGSFDRNWWHYKIRDFASVIMQQGGYFVHELKHLDDFGKFKTDFESIAMASVTSWTNRGLRKGAFEEYYPWEDGYPPLAFSTLAAAKLVDKLKIENADTEKVLRKACYKLINRFEYQAANQQIAGLAALGVLKKIRPQYVDAGKFEELTIKTLALQNSEGWFMEYDGPDLGYLSVSLDCLWDLFDYTADERFLQSCCKAFGFLTTLVLHCQSTIGMHNARNTDYIVPYGITRFLLSTNEQEKDAAHSVMQILFSDISREDHFFNAIDDRYWSHYIGHSVARAESLLQQLSQNPVSRQVVTDRTGVETWKTFQAAGYILKSTAGFTALVSCSKGGIITLQKDGASYSDFGWLVSAGKKQYVTHWWDPATTFEVQNQTVSIKGNLVSHTENTSTPLKHMVLRMVSFVFGYKIISLLKNALIFKHGSTLYRFERKITFGDSLVTINDSLYGLKGNETISQAPRSSKRHVASADSYHREDFFLNDGFSVEKSMENKNGTFQSAIRIKVS